MGLCSQCLCFWRFAGRWHRTIRIRIRIAAASHDTMPLSLWGSAKLADKVYRRGIGVRVKGVTGRDAIELRNSSRKATQ